MFQFQAEDSKHIRKYLDECGYCNGDKGVSPGVELPTHKPPVDYCSVEHNSCAEDARCLLTEGGRSFICEVLFPWNVQTYT